MNKRLELNHSELHSTYNGTLKEDGVTTHLYRNDGQIAKKHINKTEHNFSILLKTWRVSGLPIIKPD